ncbi:MAG TPA: hypothetical protein PLP50_16825 [Thermoanaerobaculia bacterium]|nr:hypothetical protein [Thermoanaerobaculia bacterium]HQN09842.1 hypothetical protein [Thermoanaerobaculia bacterium]HQP88645.1 hypothetical protein [Thermoanaerobaculia bacterium]
MSSIKVNPGDTYQAHVGGNGAAGIVAVAITVHRPTGRVVEEWTAEDFARAKGRRKRLDRFGQEMKEA